MREKEGICITIPPNLIDHNHSFIALNEIIVSEILHQLENGKRRANEKTRTTL